MLVRRHAFRTVHTQRGAVLRGASAGPVGVDLAGQRAAVGVLFRPGGAYPFFGPSPSAIDEPAVEIEALWGRDGAGLRERLLEAPTPQAALSTMEQVLLARAVRPLTLHAPAEDPGGQVTVMPLLWLAAVTAALAVIGLVGFCRRDVGRT